MCKIQLAIVDDHEIARKAVIRLLNLEDDLEVIIEAENGIDLLRKLDESKPNIILMDIQMPKMNGIEATWKVQSKYPDIKIIALTQFDNEQNIIAMYARGVKSFLSKGSGPSEIFKAVRIVYSGGAYLTEQSLRIIQSQLAVNRDSELSEINQGKYAHENKFDSNKLKSFLTPQESKLIQLLKQGKTSKEIAVELDLTVNTVRTYRDRLLKKTNTRNVTELLNICMRFA